MTNFQSKCLVRGQWISSSDGTTFPVFNPATKELLQHVPSLTANDVDRAITAAHESFEASKGNMNPLTRKMLLLELAEKVEASIDLLTETITAEQGKPLIEARSEVLYARDYFRWFAEESMRIYGDIIPSDSITKRIMVLRQPIGVVAAITPWNFPLAMLARKMAAAIAAGCTFIAKPAPETPLTALALAALCEEAEFPPGMVTILTGDAEVIAQRLMQSPVVRKISFTGSTEVGKILIRQSADTVKRLTLELGGNAPFIVFDDANIEHALSGAILGKYRNAGQTCVCVNRFLVHASVADKFTKLLVERSKNLTVGPGAQFGTEIGPLISDDAVAKVHRLVESARAQGASVMLESKADPRGPQFVSPIVVTNVTPSMDIWKEEIFGPVSSITTFQSDEEALSLANATPYGLAAYVYSSNLARALTFSELLDFGMVGINDTAISNVRAPFGGIKESGFGREGSKYGIDDYVSLKYLSVEMFKQLSTQQ